MTRAAQTDPTTPTLYLAFELGGSKWLLGFGTQITDSPRRRTLPTADATVLLRGIHAEIASAKKRFGLPHDAPVRSVYEAGREGFWLHRALQGMGVENVIVEPASLKVDRRARRAKTDQLDLAELLHNLFCHHRGEGVWRVVKVPTPDEEDLRRISRRRDALGKEKKSQEVRIKSLLVTQGIRLKTTRISGDYLGTLKRPDGSPLGEHLTSEIEDELARLRLVRKQLRQVAAQQRKLLKQQPSSNVVECAQRLAFLKGVGPISAFVLSTEFFGWREFENRRQVGSLAGLTDSPWKSDGIDRQQGISKAGNRRVRTVMVELAWNWLRWQPESDLTKWFRAYSGTGKKKRFRKVAIVALARKLLVALWHYLDHGLVPGGAVLKASRGLEAAVA